VPRIAATTIALAILIAAVPQTASTSVGDPDVVPFSDRYPVEISITDHAVAYDLARLGLDIDAVGDGWVRAYLNDAEVEAVRDLGLAVKRVPNQALRMWRAIQEAEALGEKDEYHDYAELTTFLQGVAADHPEITRLISIGQSVQDRELWFLKISDNPDVEENEPEFKYISTMHGDEPIGTENCIKFIDWITDNYDSVTPDPRLKTLVDGIEIWIMPMMNPDGNSAGSRYNANGVDLNRSFPDLIDDPNSTPVGREPEIAAVMVFSDSMSFDLSANFHTGALLVNYPYDNRSQRPADDVLFINIGETYSYHNPPMWNSPYFENGVSNGWDWYEIHGSMQDWNMDYAYNKEVTIELSDTKWPPASQLPQFWAENDTSMVAYMEYCLRGVRGVVTDSVSGSPLLATVTVQGNTWIDRTDPDVGDYHRILDPGTYTLTFSAPDYISKQFTGTVVVSDSATVLDVELAIAPRYAITGTVTSSNKAPLVASVEARYHSDGELEDSTTTDPADGSYALDVPVGEYDITVRSFGYKPETVLASVNQDTVFDFVLDPTTGNILVIDDFSGLMALSKSPDRDVRLTMPVLGSSAIQIAADLETLGFGVTLETAAASDQANWPNYDFIIWSCGDDTSPVESATHRRNLIDYASAGELLLIEGGELAYDAADYPGYPNFADSVLHVSSWNGDNVGNLELMAGYEDHPIATYPNYLPATIGITYGWYGDLDAAVANPGVSVVYGTTDYPASAGLLTHDIDGRANVVFWAFAYPAITDRGVAKDLLENTVDYILDELAGVAEEEVAARISLSATPNPFGSSTAITFALRRGGQVNLSVYDIRGRVMKTLVDGDLAAGLHTLEWEGVDAGGRRVAPGVYFCRLLSESEMSLKKIIMLR
jgi:carboxypeptidase D